MAAINGCTARLVSFGHGVRCLAVCSALIWAFVPSSAPLLASPPETFPGEAAVTLDYAIGETLLALNAPPIAMGGVAGYRRWRRDADVMRGVVELGHRHLPNFERLQALAPTRVLISPPAHANLEGMLGRIAEVERYSLFGTSDSLSERLIALTQWLGELIGAEAGAQRYLNRYDARVRELRDYIGRLDEPLIVLRLMDERHARVFGRGSLEDMVLNDLGIDNAWDGETSRWGIATLSAESLFEVEARALFLESPYSDVGTQSRLLGQGLWQHWPAVTRHDPLIVPVSHWHWGGLPSAMRFAESLVDGLSAGDVRSAEPQAGGCQDCEFHR
ncbi:ABC transporter substrate-binding protein [Billgrantia gudaonensis]|uniref:Iron complex transport system substrate-binding protein n=1 Tax=Billgrantia gudaonensis TaxID=376427 RepID=A0A1G8SN10_9GAMM|nr:ABC transporter substrate-binding protein [Halomonas gudaonensis]SDJ30553.1 iron complex transport system substrate-binding protein [Halomonas gudaonensis]